MTIFVEASPSSRNGRSHLVLACFRDAESCSEAYSVEIMCERSSYLDVRGPPPVKHNFIEGQHTKKARRQAGFAAHDTDHQGRVPLRG